MKYRVPVSSWSKAPWGLSVLARVASIFTGTSISPDALPRQGRRLLGLEFRASLALTPPLNLPAPGRRQPVYFTFRFRTDLCFC